MSPLTSRSRFFKFCLMATSALSYAYAPIVLAEDISPADTNTMRYTAPNGVPVVNIARPNGTGLSHNRYNKFNVNSNGAVLNNTTETLQSKLAGALRGNPNLTKGREASIILNEVTTANRSRLNGYVEVNGKTADVIIANPWGITANGLGFINANRATLTTGTPNIDSSGNLNSFTVRKGDLRVEGTGINASEQTYLDLIVRSAQLGADSDGKGSINAQNLHLATGANEWDYNTRNTTRTTGEGNAPTLAIDSRAFGGMYAQRIHIVATEQGVGVKTLGEMAASAEDLLITASGSLELRNDISSEKNVNITYDSDSSGQITLNGAQISSKENTTISSSNGAVDITDGKIHSDQDLTITSASLSDNGSSKSDNTRSAAGDISVTITNAISLNGTTWSAGDDFTSQSSSLSVGSSDVDINSGTDSSKTGKTTNITATNGDINLAEANITSANTTTIDAIKGGISLSGTGKIASKNNLSLQAEQGAITLTDATLETENDLIIKSDSLSDTSTSSNNRIAGNGITVTTNNNSSINGSKWSTGGELTIAAAQIDIGANGAELYAGADSSKSTRDMVLRATSGSLNLNTAKLGSSNNIELDASNGGITTSSGNDQKIEAQNNISIKALNTVQNGGEILATQQLSLEGANSATDLTVTNSGTLQAGSDLTLSGANGTNAMNITITDGAKVLGNTTKITARALTLSGENSRLQSDGIGTINLAGDLNNSGAIIGKENLTFTAVNFTNSNTSGISSLKDLTFTLSGNATNNGALFARQNFSLTATGNTVSNTSSGTIDAEEDITISTGTLNNYNDIRGGQDVTLTTTVAFNNIMNVLNGTMTDVRYTYSGMTQAQFAAYNNQIEDRVVVFNQGDGTTGQIFNTGITHGDHVGNRMSTSTASDDLNWSTYQFLGRYTEESGLFACADGCGQYTYKMVRGQTRVTERNVLSAGASVDKSVISAGGTLNINYGSGTAKNDGSILTADTVNITGTGDFTNNARAHERTTEYAMYKYFVYAADDSDDPDVNRFSYYTAATTLQDEHGRDIPQEDVSKFNFADDGNWTTASSQSSAEAHALANLIYGGSEQLSSVGAGIFANTLNISTPGNFDNVGYTVSEKVGTANAQAATNTAKTAASANTLNLSLPNISFNITLPNNPNGYFVTSKDPDSQYLVETNPAFGLDGNYLGSEYLYEKLNIQKKSVETTRRLGDAAYENYLIQKQITQQTGRTVLGKFKQNAELQTKTLMDNAALAAKDMKLNYGVALSKEQIANLKNDIVWMVETVVNGQKVLSPVVYLAKATLEDVDPGNAVITARDTNINVGSLTNTGGSIEGGDNLNITSTGNITNTAGTIKGGNVQVASVSGSIINETVARNVGGAIGDTEVSKQASISSTGSLDLNAKEDIRSVGAKISSDGNASLNAGGNVELVGLQTSTRSFSAKNETSGRTTNFSGSQTTTTKNIGSGLDVGNNLSVKSGKDITIQGSDVNTKGNANLEADGNLNLLAAKEGTTTTSLSGSTTKAASFGIVKSASSSTRTEKTDSIQTAAVSNLNIGGNLSAKAGNDIKSEGTAFKSGGDMAFEAGGNVEFAEARESRESTSKTTSRSNSGGIGALSVDSFRNTETWDTASTAKGSTINSGGNFTVKSSNDITFTGAKIDVAGNSQLDAKNDIKIQAAEEKSSKGSKSSSGTSVGLLSSVLSANFSKEKSISKLTNKGSDLNFGGDLKASSGRDFVVQGSDVNVKGDGDINAGRDKRVLAAQNRTLTVDKSSQDFGLIGSLVGDLNKSKSTTIDELRNQGSTEAVGGNLNISAKRDILIQGSQINAGKDATVSAGRNQLVIAAQDKTTTTTVEKVDKGFSLYAEAGASNDLSSGNGQAGAGVQGVGTNAGSASAGIGIQRQFETTTTTNIKTTAVVSGISAGGNLTRKAGEKLLDQGTNIRAGENYDQSAKTILQAEAKNTETTTKTTNTQTIRHGLYAEASGEENFSTNAKALIDKGKSIADKNKTVTSGDASVANRALAYGGARAQSGTISTDIQNLLDSEASGGASAGVETRITNKTVTETTSTSTSVGPNIQVGGNFNSSSENDTTLRGATVKVGGKANLSGENINILAAENTKTETTTTDTQQAYTRVGVDVSATASAEGAEADAGINAEVGALSANQRDSKTSSNAVVASFEVGQLNISSENDTVLEGTKIKSDDGVNITAKKGDVTVKQAENTITETSSSSSVGAYGKVGIGTDATIVSGGGGANFNKANTNSNEVTGIGSQINTGKGGLNISSGNNVTLQGVDGKGEGGLNINAKNNIDITTANSSKTSNSNSLNSQIDFEVGGEDSSLEAKANIKAADASEMTQQGSKLNFGQGITTKAGNDTTITGAQLSTDGDVDITSTGKVTLAAATNTSNSKSGELGLSVEIGGSDVKPGFDATGSISTSQNQTGTQINAQNLNIKSNKETTLVGTQANLEGSADIDAKGGVKTKQTTSYEVSASASLTSTGLSIGEASANVEKTSVNIKEKKKAPKKVADNMKKVKELMKSGQSKEAALKSLGIKPDIFETWLKDYPALAKN